MASNTTIFRPRKETRAANGTLTLRRSSTNPLGTSTQSSTTFEQTTTVSTSESLSQSQSYSSHALDSTDSRYSKDKLLDIFKAQQAADNDNDVARLYVNNWDPEHSNGSTARGWGKSTDARDHNHGPEICWDQSGQVQPIGLEEMSALEKSVSIVWNLVQTYC
jgi:PERQ amino acid-rich with GYF domain-containing protein